MPLDTYGWRIKEYVDWRLSQKRGKIGGHFSEEKESRGEGWKCEGWLDRSPTGNQEKAGDKSWGVLALLLSHSLLSLSSSLFPCIVK